MGSMSRSIKRKATGAKSFERMTPHERAVAMARNGITHQDVQKSYDLGYADGRRAGIETMSHVIYAAILLTLKSKGFADDECFDTLMAIDHQTLLCFDSEDLANEAFESTGIQLEWDQGVNRVRKVAEHD